MIARVSENDYALVQEGRYEGNLRIKNGDPEIEKLVKPWRREIEDNPEVMRGIAEKYYSIPMESGFGYMYVGADSVSHRVVLRYFAYDPHPVIMAGWQIMFVFDRGAKKLVNVCTTEVPLE